MNEKTIADVQLDVDQSLELEHLKEMFDSASEEEKAEYLAATAEEIKALVLRYLHLHRNDAEALFNLLRGVTKLADFKEQGMGVIYINGEFATNLYKESEIVHISYNTCADEEEIENLKQEV